MKNNKSLILSHHLLSHHLIFNFLPYHLLLLFDFQFGSLKYAIALLKQVIHIHNQKIFLENDQYEE